MSNNINRNNRWVPVIIAISVVVGIVIGTFFANRFAGNRLNIINTSSNKLNDLLHIIDDQYVDTVDIANIVEQSMPKILEELDPHSTYISAQDAKTANDDLKGSFSGVGIQFVIREDTVRVTGIIKGGPSEKVGILAGDKIISVNDEPYVGEVVTNEETLHRLKGEKGTKVKIGVLRHGQKKPLSFTVVRGDIPLKSVDATYMINKELGYIKSRTSGKPPTPNSSLPSPNWKWRDSRDSWWTYEATEVVTSQLPFRWSMSSCLRTDSLSIHKEDVHVVRSTGAMDVVPIRTSPSSCSLTRQQPLPQKSSQAPFKTTTVASSWDVAPSERDSYSNPWNLPTVPSSI